MINITLVLYTLRGCFVYVGQKENLGHGDRDGGWMMV